MSFRSSVWGTVADWAGAIASASASVVALWIALRSDRSRVSVNAVPEHDPAGTLIGVRAFVTNRGFTTLDVMQIVGLWGILRPRYVLLGQMLADRARLSHGEYSHHLLDWRRFSQFEDHARRQRPLWFIERRFARSVRVGVLLSTGEHVYATAPLVMRYIRRLPVELDPTLPPPG